VGELGILTVLALIVATVILSRGRWTFIRSLPEGEKSPVQQARVQTQPGIQDTTSGRAVLKAWRSRFLRGTMSTKVTE
jgi:hypothetical protein